MMGLGCQGKLEWGKKADLFIFEFLFGKVPSFARGLFSPESNFLFC